ncbi:enamine deaminase RidA (YjgF/YER057c/UK114 family) [Aquimarina sp. EL_43]|uniref:RidA family protein n=1 Tax=unclassified Aquimarina TaxID=2627091 RepID=UPI0018C9796F|nr:MULTISPECIES: RidA family protein [unclassified Aquimarina]MBG6133433.1 enamine deaminase RidA (YjgF/YER057c/UK114 family) [Aquimarina sp. EL_35]MBG6153591.1 enamine deaminase RidA (YjgF/YER057c/UK114 family) [Aquimarina sp. EL_32]MBG6171747.1 enamine deaminase RidA (YjgF/YER057c/UK114 family) [Aquimarina sp. EL_43]
MKNRKNVSSGSPWEDIVGYSRAVKVGNIIEVSGTTATGKDGNIIGIDNPYLQTKTIIETAKNVLEEMGYSLDNVIRTRIYTTDISQWEAIGKAHGEYFGTIKPTTAMVEIAKLINPDMLVEIEFTAIVD